jgi:guanyl-specific ribonuclease Sa
VVGGGYGAGAQPSVNSITMSAGTGPNGGGITTQSTAPQSAIDVANYVGQNGGSPPTGYVGGRTFQNDGRGGGEVLPTTDSQGNPITYREYDVNPRTPGVNRGSERVVIGSDGRAYYTNNHYSTFTPIRSK